MTPQDIGAGDESNHAATRRNVMKTGAAIGGALAVGGSTSGVATAHNHLGQERRPARGGGSLLLDGVEGDLTDPPGGIGVIGWEWGAAVPGQIGSGPTQFEDLTVTKFVDRTTPSLWEHLALGIPIADGELVVGEAEGEGSFSVGFAPAFVTSINASGPADTRPGIEEITLRFDEFTIAAGGEEFTFPID